MMRTIFFLVVAAGLAQAGGALAASFDCTKAKTPLERQICADPKLSEADSRLGALYQRALAVTPLPMTLRHTQRDWLKNRVASLSAYEDQTRTLERMIVAAEKTRREIPAADLSKRCVAVPDDPSDYKSCKVAKAGRLQTAVEGPLLWQLTELQTPEGSTSRGILLARALPGGRARPEIWLFEEDSTLDEPQLAQSRYGPLLVLPAQEDAHAIDNKETVFRWRDGRWVELDVQAWKYSFSRHTPNQLGIQMGVGVDYNSLTASTPLWKKDDATRFPTGGAAQVSFRLDGDTLVVDSVKAKLGRKAAQAAAGQ